MAAVPEGEQHVLVDLVVASNERYNTEHLRARLYQDAQAIPGAHRTSLSRERTQEPVARSGLRLRVLGRLSGPCPCAKVAEPVFDADRTSRQSMKCVDDALQTLASG